MDPEAELEAGRGHERPAPRAAAAAVAAAGRRGSVPAAVRSGLLDTLRDRLQAAQTFFFGALFFMTDRGGRDPDVIRGLIIPVALVVTDACQLLSLALSGAWYAPSVKWLTSGVSLVVHFEAVPAASFALYWFLAALLVGTFLLVVYASYMFKQHSFRVLPIRILCFVAPLLVSAFYIPCLKLLAAPFLCLLPSAAPGEWLTEFCDVTPWTHYLTLSVSALLLLLFVPFAALIAAVFHDNDPLSVDISARAHGRLQLAYVLLQSALVFASRALEGRHPTLFASLLAAGCLLLAALTVVLLPHYSSAMNMLRAGCFLAAAVFALGSITLNYADPSLSIPISITFILLLVPVALLGALAVHLRSRRILRRVLHKARTGFADAFDLEAVGAQESERGDQFQGGIPRGRRAPITFGFLSRSKGLLVEVEVELEARAAIAASDSMPDALPTAEAIYEEGMNRHKGSQYVALHYAIFLCSFKKNRSSAMMRLRLAEKSPRRSIDMSFFLAAKRREWTQREYSASLGETAGVSAVAVLEFQMLMDEATQHQNNALRETRLLWRHIAKAAGSIHSSAAGALASAAASASASARNRGGRRSVLLPGAGRAMRLATEGLEARVAAIHKAKRAAEAAYKRLLSRFSRSPNLWRAYAYFLLVVNEEREATAAFARADELEESAALEVNLSGGSVTAGTANADEDDFSESASSKHSKAKRERQRGGAAPRASNPVSELLIDAALGGTRAVRDLRRAIVAACAALLVLLVGLCSIALVQLGHQDFSLDEVLSSYFLPRTAVAVVDATRSAVLAASSPPDAAAYADRPADPRNVTTAADALAAVVLHSRALLDASKRLYYNGDMTAHLWEETRVDGLLYLRAGPQSPAASLPVQAPVWDAVAALVAKAQLLPALPAPAAMTSTDFRYVADVGLGPLLRGLDALSGGYRAHFQGQLRLANDVFIGLVVTIGSLVVLFAFGVFRPLVNRVIHKKLDLSAVILRIPRPVAHIAARHYASLRLVTADSSEEEEALEGLDDMNHFGKGDEAGDDPHPSAARTHPEAHPAVHAFAQVVSLDVAGPRPPAPPEDALAAEPAPQALHKVETHVLAGPAPASAADFAQDGAGAAAGEGAAHAERSSKTEDEGVSAWSSASSPPVEEADGAAGVASRSAPSVAQGPPTWSHGSQSEGKPEGAGITASLRASADLMHMPSAGLSSIQPEVHVGVFLARSPSENVNVNAIGDNVHVAMARTLQFFSGTAEAGLQAGAGALFDAGPPDSSDVDRAQFAALASGPGPASAGGSGRSSPATGYETHGHVHGHIHSQPRKSVGPGRAPSAIRRLQAASEHARGAMGRRSGSGHSHSNSHWGAPGKGTGGGTWQVTGGKGT